MISKKRQKNGSLTKKNNKVLFSIIIPTYNEEKTIGKLLKKLHEDSREYSIEVIIIDSQSIDRTRQIIDKYKKFLWLRFFTIEKSEFNHGETRNMGVKLSKGKFILFLSGDVVPLNKDIFRFLLDDFLWYKNAVAVYGKQIPSSDMPRVQKIEMNCHWDRFDSLTDEKGIFIQNNKSVKNLDKFLSYFISDACACYRRSFLIKFAFPKINYGEDIMQGMRIISKGFNKIYDSRCIVIHYDNQTFIEYFKRYGLFIRAKSNFLNLSFRGLIFCQIRKTFNLYIPIYKKTLILIEICIIYIFKFIILIYYFSVQSFKFLFKYSNKYLKISSATF